MQATPRLGGGERLGCPREQLRADAAPLAGTGDVDVVEQRAPRRVLVENDVSEADQAAALLGEDRQRRGIAARQPLAPFGQPIGDDVAVQERVGVGAAVVAPPAVGVQGRHCARVRSPGKTELALHGHGCILARARS